MMSKYIELTATPDWGGDKSIAFDVDHKVLFGSLGKPERLFLPKSQTIERDGVVYVSGWIIQQKVEQLIGSGATPESARDGLALILCSREVEENSDLDLITLWSFFNEAANSLSTPKVVFGLPFGRLKFNRSGENAKQPGVVHVSDGKEWGDRSRVYYGSIKTDGSFRPSRDCTPEVKEFLEAFNSDPVGTAASQGQASGNCCFCYKELTVERSRSVGYGPTCAKNFGLPY